MATIEKEKVLDVVRQMVADGQVSQEVAEKYFPELKENERIRKAILSGLKYLETELGWDAIGDIDILDTYAWLEKQGVNHVENNEMVKSADKVEPKFRIGDVIEVKPMKCHGKIFTDNLNKIVDITEKSYILDDGKAYSIELQDGWKLSEQKFTEWSEEDEKKRKCLIKGLEDRMGFGWASDPFSREEYINWLKSLKERVQLQKQWRPTEEQMKQLGWIAKQNKDNMIGKELMTLYNDLQKLRKE